MTRYFLYYRKPTLRAAREFRRHPTEAERKLWNALRGNRLGVHFRRQVPLGPYVLDFFAVSLRLAVEVDGGQHYTPEGRRRDERRTAYLEAHGVTVLRFTDREVLTDLRGVLSAIYQAVVEGMAV